MSSTNRPCKRELVRWNDDLDKSLLLYLIYTCSEAGIKIPFKRVAELMAQQHPKNFTEGAVVQHVAKLRTVMFNDKAKEENADNVDLLVPPSLKRGSVTKAPSSFYGSDSKKRKVNQMAENAQATNNNLAVKGKGRKIKKESDADGDEDDSDYDGSSSKKKAKKAKKPTLKKEANTLAPTPTSLKEEAEEEGDNVDSATASPGMHTRGIKTSYAKMDGDVSDYEDSDPDEHEESEAAAPAPKSSAPKSPLSGKIASPRAEVDEKAPFTNVAQAAPLYNNSGAALMPAIGSGAFSNLNSFNPNSMLQQPFDLSNALDFDDISLPAATPTYGANMYTEPFAADYGGMKPNFNTQVPGFWNPPTTVTPASTRNNSTASSINNPTPLLTPAAADMSASVESDFDSAFGNFTWDDALLADSFNMDDFMKYDGGEVF